MPSKKRSTSKTSSKKPSPSKSTQINKDYDVESHEQTLILDSNEGRGRNAPKLIEASATTTSSNGKSSSSSNSKALVLSKPASTALVPVNNGKKSTQLRFSGRTTKSKSVHETYRKMSGIEHILHRPELYVGMMEQVTEIWWVPNSQNANRMQRRSVTFSPALFKIFDEILVNAADNKMRSKNLQTAIHVSVNHGQGTISVFNDGPGIPIVKHNEHKLYIPHLIFGHLLTSSNYDDNESKITGGRHGYGAKLTNVFSKEFTVETARRGVHYEKSWSKNMSMSHHEVISNSYKGTDFTKITFKPDVQRFAMKELDDDIIHLFHRRTLDVAATCGVVVHWNGAKAEVNSFLDYSLHFLPKKNTRVLISLQGSTNLGAEKPMNAVSAAAHEAEMFKHGQQSSKQQKTTAAKDKVPEKEEKIEKGNKNNKNTASTITNNNNNKEKTNGDNNKKDNSKNESSTNKNEGNDQTAPNEHQADDVVDEPVLDDQAAKKAHREFGKLMAEIKQAAATFTRRDCLVFHQKSRHWDVVLAFHLDGGVDKNDHVSFVNNVATHNGGSHLRHVQEKVIDYLVSGVKIQLRKEIARLLRSMMQVFVNAVIHNPTFGSQIKDKLITPESNFLATFNLNPKIKDAFQAADLSTRIIEFAQNQLGLAAQRNAMKSVKIHGRISLPKLEDANWAGSDKANQCTLILTEGDSAKALAVSGLAVIGRDKFGVYPLKGKLMNVREQTLKRVAENDQFSDVMKAMGLRFNVNYDPADPQLRYGRIMIMADQDHDGSHIKGLVMNFIHRFWPTLLDRPGFITQFITPIIKALPRTKTDAVVPRNFFSIPDFNRWKAALSALEQRRYLFKYYKGLGTSTSAEGREYFQNIDRHEIVMMRNTAQPKKDDTAIELAFASDQIEGRKIWVSSYSVDDHVGVDFRKKTLTYGDFIHKELILFSVADCERSIPSIIDGLKPSQRKIMFAAFKRNLTKSVKVAQFCGVVGEISGYHHGEASLQGAIVGLAQDFVGSNNINFLLPEGQFGTRHEAGKDHASARYIFTRLNPLTRCIFPVEDDPLLKYRDDDGFPIEPHFYVPIIPTVLVNGASGIGTGFATSIPSFHPLEIISNVRRLLKGKIPLPMSPWYDGFTGEFHLHKEVPPPAGADVPFHKRDRLVADQYHYTTNVVYIGSDESVINVDDLAPGTSTALVKKTLVDLVRQGKVKDFVENHTPSTVSFTVEVETSGIDVDAELEALDDTKALVPTQKPPVVQVKRAIQKNPSIIEDAAAAALAKQKEKILNKNVADVFHELTKKRTSFRTSNMYAFDRYGSLRLFEDVNDVMKEHFEVRMQVYKMRYEYVMIQLEHNLAVENGKYSFIRDVLGGKLRFRTLRNEAALLQYIKKDKVFAKNIPAKLTPVASTNAPEHDVDSANNNSKYPHRTGHFNQRTLIGNDNNNNILQSSHENDNGNQYSDEHHGENDGKKHGNNGKLISDGNRNNDQMEGNTKSRNGTNSNSSTSGYEYLMRLPISSFNQQNLVRSSEKVQRCQEELEAHKKMSPTAYYKRDLLRLEDEVTKYFEEREKARKAETPIKSTDEKNARAKSAEKKGKDKKRKSGGNGDDDDGNGSVSRLARMASERYVGSSTRDPSSFAMSSLAPLHLVDNKKIRNINRDTCVAPSNLHNFVMFSACWYEEFRMLSTSTLKIGNANRNNKNVANMKETIINFASRFVVKSGKSMIPRFIF